MLRLPLSIRLNGVIEFLRERHNGDELTGASIHEVMSFLNIKDIHQRLESQWGEESLKYDEGVRHEEFPVRAMAARKTVQETPEMPILPPSLLPTSSKYEADTDDKRLFTQTMHTAMVAQLVKDKATLKSDECRKVINKEWEALLKRECWDIRKAEKWKIVKARSDQAEETIHLGSLLELVYEKHSELEPEKTKVKGKSRVSRKPSQGPARRLCCVRRNVLSTGRDGSFSVL